MGGKKKEVYILGHRNPDTDSICSAIAYADVKNKENDGNHYVAARAGQLSPETSYVLQRFGMRQPTYVNNIGTRVRDMEIRKIPGISEDISMKKAWNLMAELNAVTLPIIDADNRLNGLITINDIATSYMENQDSTLLAMAKTPYRNILETLEAELVVGDPEAVFEHGNVLIAVANPDVMENYIEHDDMVITGNRYESQLSAIESGAGCIVICLGAQVSRSIQKLALDNGCAVLVTPLDTYTVARRINQCMPVRAFMRTKNLITFLPGDYTDSIKDSMQNTRIRDFPVVDKTGQYLGMISRRNLLGIRKRSVILVDHNERSQAVDNIEDAEILEIIDHHRIGSLETMAPVYFRNEPVGCTATIIYQIYREKGFDIPPNIAGLLCSAILSDTLVFRSPTCTMMDRMAAQALSEIAGIDCQAFGIEMFTAGSNLKDKTPEEIFYQDYKKFEFGDVSFGVGQINSMSGGELDEIEKRLRPYLEKSCKEHGLSMMFFMLTNIIEESTRLMCYGESADTLVQEAFGRSPQAGTVWLKGVVSRKKQLIPAFIEAINKEAAV
ncbi:putative manganese-dependent inorganic diphosphatase [Anaeromassilibacillus senegalensis]|uniref:inorganic diphosphatase n=1 Tax=Anaeromassilibacillus senegalensis TaxID=1673717 RepID=A0ABS9CPK7_9FIRM|nr:putative manganese-dependent inorganic diphosphatase [Anaeromassilibacillus senegalensis]MCF2653075.1 putative manganese-dependent inorganic diphosphatase [Anaeromassilibacillus senegalensis]